VGSCDGVTPGVRSVVTQTRVTCVLNFGGMPIYEYDCRDCRRVVSLLVLRPSAAAAPTCPRCGGAALNRVMSRFATVKSEEARLESMADPSSLGDLDENDPASVGRFMKRMGQEMGEDLGDDFNEAVDEAMTETGGEDADSPSDSSPGDL
jgi:putative FmdB family regulatory protein